MLIRVFSESDIGLAKYFQFVRLEMGVQKQWGVETCNPMRWLPDETKTNPTQTPTQTQTQIPTTAAIHIYIGTPVRLAIPWAAFNVLVGEAPSPEMDAILPASALARDRAIKTVRSLLQLVRKSPGVPTIPGHVLTDGGVAVITLTRDRPEWWANMIHNIIHQDKTQPFEWVIVDDSVPSKRITAQIDEFRVKMPTIRVTYLVLDSPTSIGEKRNAGCRAASPETRKFVMMDDDDHYPSTSVSNRVSWLSRSPIVYCATLPVYDIKRYISAINVPPLDAPIGLRASEASLAFTREAWEERPFEDVWMDEGNAFLSGREKSTVEISPTPVIVSFVHSSNTGSRRVPEGQEPNGCHFGFTDDFFKYLHDEAA